MAKINLLAETIHVLETNGHNPSDVRWVGSNWNDYSMDWDAFAKIANVDYDNSYGGAEIASDLVVVGDDWWLERGEYDGSEWWEYKKIPTASKNPTPFHKVTDKIE